MIYGCLQPRELWFIDFNHVCGWMLRSVPYSSPASHMYIYKFDNHVKYMYMYVHMCLHCVDVCACVQ